jgi:isoleucyl-tRNA synthetase
VKLVEKLEGDKHVALDLVLTPELKEEGDVRDLIRTIQDLRKKAGLEPSDRIAFTTTNDLALLVEKYKETIMSTVGAVGYTVGDVVTVLKQ